MIHKDASAPNAIYDKKSKKIQLYYMELVSLHVQCTSRLVNMDHNLTYRIIASNYIFIISKHFSSSSIWFVNANTTCLILFFFHSFCWSNLQRSCHFIFFQSKKREIIWKQNHMFNHPYCSLKIFLETGNTWIIILSYVISEYQRTQRQNPLG
jgi:hypothetical protein